MVLFANEDGAIVGTAGEVGYCSRAQLLYGTVRTHLTLPSECDDDCYEYVEENILVPVG